jgi:hypothetical protein
MLQVGWIGSKEVVFEKSIVAAFSITLDIAFAWPCRAPELWFVPLVVLMDEGCHNHHQFGITVRVIISPDDVLVTFL